MEDTVIEEREKCGRKNETHKTELEKGAEVISKQKVLIDTMLDDRKKKDVTSANFENLEAKYEISRDKVIN